MNPSDIKNIKMIVQKHFEHQDQDKKIKSGYSLCGDKADLDAIHKLLKKATSE